MGFQRGVTFWWLIAVSWCLIADGSSARGQEKAPAIEILPSRVTVRIVKTLESHLSLVENNAGECPGVEAKAIQNVTLPLQNYLEDVVLPSGEYVEIYPILLRDIICEEYLRGTPKREIALLLLTYQKKKAYQEIWRPEKGHGG